MKLDHDIAIQLTGVSKKYEIHHEKPTLVEKFIKNSNETFWALQNINLVIQKGERLGIFGPNGSGKTTLLKIIANITTPTTGTIQTHGKIVSLIDLEAGFHPDLTGLQNIYLNSMLLGMSKREIDRQLNSIVAFADIGRYIDVPLFTYSQGMKLRLGFSIGIHAKPDILILDESMGVGDVNFQKKSHKKILELMSKGLTLLIVSHDMSFFKKNSSRRVYLHHGQIVKIAQ